MFTRNLFKSANSLLIKRNRLWSTLNLNGTFCQASPHSARRKQWLNPFKMIGYPIKNENEQNRGNIKFIYKIQSAIDLILRYNSVSLELEFEKEKKIFFINDNFTFNVLKEMIEFEYPSCSVDFDFSRGGSQLLDTNSNLFNFLRSDEKGEVIVEIDNDQYLLRNSGCSVLSQFLTQVQKESQESQGALHWFLKCQQNKIHPSHAGVLSHLISQFQNEVKTLKTASKREINLSETELDNIFIKTFKSFSTPVMQEMERIQHEKNIIDQELNKLYEKRDKLYDAATRRANFYLKLILLISLGHIASFYYMIFHVDWLGWDIIEPITYTVAQLSVVLAIRFFWKHKQVRSVESILNIAKQKYLSKRVIKDFYANLKEQITLKEQEKSFLEKKYKILLNKKTYNTISLHDI